MLILKAGEVCGKANTCQYNADGLCQGTYSNRQTEFTCTYITDGAICKDGVCRNINDTTGKMRPIRG